MVVKKTENGKLQKCISSILGLSIFFYEGVLNDEKADAIIKVDTEQ